MVMNYNLCSQLTVHLNSYIEKQNKHTLPTQAQIANGFFVNSESSAIRAKIIEYPADIVSIRG